MKNFKLHAYAIFLIAFPVAFLFTTSLFFAIANAADVTLAWDANTEGNLAGYKLYYDGDSDTEIYQGTGANEGDSPVVIYLDELESADSPSFTLTGLTEGEYYYFSLTAFDTNGVESDFSDEVGVLMAVSNNTATAVSDTATSETSSDEDGGGGCFISGSIANHSAGFPMTVAGICLILGTVAVRREAKRLEHRA